MLNEQGTVNWKECERHLLRAYDETHLSQKEPQPRKPDSGLRSEDSMLHTTTAYLTDSSRLKTDNGYLP
jgi:hypothetical protein